MLKVAYHPSYIHPLPENHRFPMEKYELLYSQLLYEGTIDHENIFEPGLIDLDLVLRVHDEKYVERLYGNQLTDKEQRVTGFKHSPSLISREQMIMEGTRLCASHILNGGIAMNIAGGTHHAFTNRGEGFCLLNDQAIAAQWLLDSTHVEKVLIVDLDVHQGNGTAEIFRSNDQVFTLSLHGASNYPLNKEESNMDVGLEDGIQDEAYLRILKHSLDEVLNRFTPDFVFYQCGVDVVATDKLGRLGLSREGCKQRDRFVLETFKEIGLPVVCSMGGGYSREIRDIVEAHANTFRLAQEIYY